MKKLLLLVLGFLIFNLNAYASDAYVVWHDLADNAYTTDYDGILKASEKKSFKNGAIVGKGNANLTIKNLRVYDLMFTDKWTLELDGTSTVNTIEVSSRDALTIKGSGVLKVKSIGLSMEEMTSPKDANHKEVIDKYLKGNYSLGASGDYIVITGLDAQSTTTTTTTTKTLTTSVASTTTTTQEASIDEPISSSTTTSSSLTTTTNKKENDGIGESKLVKDNTTLYMAIGGACAVVLIGALILKLKK